MTNEKFPASFTVRQITRTANRNGLLRERETFTQIDPLPAKAITTYGVLFPASFLQAKPECADFEPIPSGLSIPCEV